MKVTPKRLLDFYASDQGFYPDKERVLSAILFLMERKPGITQYPLVKSVFFADKWHLNKYGRPITYDSYSAMDMGPVPSLTYDLLKPSKQADFVEIYGFEPPWRTERQGKARRHFALKSFDPSVLSRTDLSNLEQALNHVTSTPAEQLDYELHNDPAYLDVWNASHAGSSVAIRTFKLLADEDEDLIQHLAYASRH